jgi:hypothetical protein
MKLTDHAVMAAKAMIGRITWMETERWEGMAKEVGRPARCGDIVQDSEPS